MTITEQGTAFRLDALLERAARTKPGRDAIIFRGKAWTYAEVHERACHLAGALARLGVQKGDRVAFWATNRPEFVEFIFGVPKLGALAAPLDHWWTCVDAIAAIEQIRPSVIIAGGVQAAELARERDLLEAAGIEHFLCLDEPPPGPPFNSYARELSSAPTNCKVAPVAPGDPATVFFTSGSTGRSKGAFTPTGALSRRPRS